MPRFGDVDIVPNLAPPAGYKSWLAVPIKSLTTDVEIGNFTRELNEARAKADRWDAVHARWTSIDPKTREDTLHRAQGLRLLMPQIWGPISVALDILRSLG